jgi:hypothetical protein
MINTPTAGNIASNQDILHLYPLGHSMVPSSGRMAFPSVRHDNNPGAKT